MRVLLTGAAGFIGGAVGTALLKRGHEVVAVDALIPQAHPTGAHPADGMHQLDVRDGSALRPVLEGVDVVCHQAAMVGAGLSPVDLPLYAAHNDLGTAVLLAAMAEEGVGRLVLASSMVVYGDGRYRCDRHGAQPGTTRRLADLEAGQFEVTCPVCSAPMGWQLVEEDAPLHPRSSYAASKVAQEHFAAAWSRQLPAAVLALRYHNVYGPRMPQDTPYSGVAAIFRSSLERGEPPRVYEDGDQMRDFVHVSDVAAANVLAVEQVLTAPADSFAAYNICSGRPISIADVARRVAAGASTARGGPVVTGEFRAGDVRHVVASPELARVALGFTARVTPEKGLAEFATAPLRPVTSR